MFEYEDVSRLDAGAALGVLERAQQVKRQAEVQEALAMLQVVRTYRHQIPTDKVRLGAEGTGLVDDFACLELAAALHRSLDSVTPQVIELLNLEARLPRLWETTLACGVPVWLGRRIARLTGELSLARALWLDATIAPFTTRLGPARLLTFVEALVVQADPDAAEARWARQNRPRVEIGQVHRDGLRDIYGWLPAADATFLDAALEQLSGILARQGSADEASVRRATALGILATPARALAMIQAAAGQPTLPAAESHPTAPKPGMAPELGMVPEPGMAPKLGMAPGLGMVPELDEGPLNGQPSAGAATPEDAGEFGPRSPSGCTGHTCGTITVPPDQLLPKTTLVIHLSDDTLVTGNGLGRCEQLGPVTIQQIKKLLDNTQVTALPVFNPNGIIPVDAYEIPERIRRAVLARHPYEVFPYGTHRATNCDLDHTIPYRAGGTAQTGPDNLGALRRKTHRGKTHAGWQLKQPEPGRYLWTSPLGRRYIVTTAGLTTDHRHTPGANPWDSPLGGPLLPDPPRRPATVTRNTRKIGARPVLRR